MKSMILVSDSKQIPLKIIELASQVNDLVGDMNISVEISDNDTGKTYSIQPNRPVMALVEGGRKKECPLLRFAR